MVVGRRVNYKGTAPDLGMVMHAYSSSFQENHFWFKTNLACIVSS